MKLLRRFGLIILVGSCVSVLSLLFFTTKCTVCERNHNLSVDTDFQLKKGENGQEYVAITFNTTLTTVSDKKIGGELSNVTIPPQFSAKSTIPTDVQIHVKQLLQWYELDVDRKDLGVKECWKFANNWVHLDSIHPDITPELGAVLRAMSTARIRLADIAYSGTQLKIILLLEGNQTVIFKPKWYERDKEVGGGPIGGHDRHNGEIASFHLNRIMGFRRVPLSAGRVINFDKEIRPVATKAFLKTVFRKGERSCFVRKCTYCVIQVEYICTKGQNTELEGVIINYLPEKFKLAKQRHPWRRTYSNDFKANWEIYNNFCHSVIVTHPYDQGTLLLDILDGAIFDYLLQNADRHHIESFADSKNTTFIMLDNGKSFGNSLNDEYTILAPIYQCCRLRKSTWLRLLLLKNGALSIVLKEILSKDSIAPVLADSHYKALDRRLKVITKTVDDCIEKHGEVNVLVVRG